MSNCLSLVKSVQNEWMTDVIGQQKNRIENFAMTILLIWPIILTEKKKYELAFGPTDLFCRRFFQWGSCILLAGFCEEFSKTSYFFVKKQKNGERIEQIRQFLSGKKINQRNVTSSFLKAVQNNLSLSWSKFKCKNWLYDFHVGQRAFKPKLNHFQLLSKVSFHMYIVPKTQNALHRWKLHFN